MSRFEKRWIGPAVLVTALAFFASASHAELNAQFQTQGGYFKPYHGSGGYYVSIAGMKGIKEGKFNFGGELEYQSYDPKPFNTVHDFNSPSNVFVIPKLKTETLVLRFLFQWQPMPDAMIRPYLGAGVGASVNWIDDRTFELATRRGNSFIPLDRRQPGLDVKGVAGVGVGVPKLEWLELFGEFKAGYNYIVQSSTAGNVTTAFSGNIGGFGVGGGIRLKY